MAQSVNLRSVRPRPELGVKPNFRLNARTSQFDPQPTFDRASERERFGGLPIRLPGFPCP